MPLAPKQMDTGTDVLSKAMNTTRPSAAKASKSRSKKKRRTAGKDLSFKTMARIITGDPKRFAD